MARFLAVVFCLAALGLTAKERYFCGDKDSTELTNVRYVSGQGTDSDGGGRLNDETNTGHAMSGGNARGRQPGFSPGGRATGGTGGLKASRGGGGVPGDTGKAAKGGRGGERGENGANAFAGVGGPAA